MRRRRRIRGRPPHPPRRANAVIRIHRGHSSHVACSWRHRWDEDLGARVPVDGVRLGRANLDAVSISSDTLAYLCGLMPFMIAIRDALIARNIHGANIRYEVFGPDSSSRELA
jgi:ferredoxin-NADP reductase